MLCSRFTHISVYSPFSMASISRLRCNSKLLLHHLRSQYINTTALRCAGEYEWQDAENFNDVVNVTVISKDKQSVTIKGKVGDNLLYLCHRYNIEMEGACEASLACTTCHCYVHFDYLAKLPTPDEKEEDLLDMAPFLQENSRLGCQIKLTKDLDGVSISLPLATRNFYVDGHKPKPH